MFEDVRGGKLEGKENFLSLIEKMRLRLFEMGLKNDNHCLILGNLLANQTKARLFINEIF